MVRRHGPTAKPIDIIDADGQPIGQAFSPTGYEPRKGKATFRDGAIRLDRKATDHLLEERRKAAAARAAEVRKELQALEENTRAREEAEAARVRQEQQKEQAREHARRQAADQAEADLLSLEKRLAEAQRLDVAAKAARRALQARNVEAAAEARAEAAAAPDPRCTLVHARPHCPQWRDGQCQQGATPANPSACASLAMQRRARG